MSHPTHPLSFDYPSHIWRGIPIMKLLTVQLSPVSCYFLLSSVQIFSTFCSPGTPVYDMHIYPIGRVLFISHITLNKHPKYYVFIYLKIVPNVRTI
jgi:hypothetical protein